ncbi:MULTISPECIES: DUF732 domain-containing protein [Mycobacteriaceae]|uniref:DUF732 domain-containing protein n=1 Tax=Mycobacteriaceae TaxID=1762 RepID=UPI00336BF178
MGRGALVAGTALALLALQLSPHVAFPARAELGDYLYDLTNAGIGGPQPQLESLGRTACDQAHAGVTRDDSVALIQRDTKLVPEDAAFLYDSAMHFLCP